MTSGVAILLALALAMVALALMLWSRAERRAGQGLSKQFLESRFAGVQGSVNSSSRGADGAESVNGVRNHADRSLAAGAVTQVVRPGISGGGRSVSGTAPPAVQPRTTLSRNPRVERLSRWFDDLLSRGGIKRTWVFLAVAGTPTAALCLVSLARIGWIGAIIMLLVCAAVAYFVLSVMTSRRHQALVRQLPPFLDTIVRLLTIGNSIPSAFQTAIGATEAPLRDCLERASRMLRGGMELDRALYQTARIYKVQELELLAAVMRLAVKYGGRADVVLERMAGFMRDLDMAQRELVALSAETRLSAWVLCLLPILIGVFLVMTNPQYFAGMWLDDTGRELLYGAAGLQVAGCFLLYRLAKL